MGAYRRMLPEIQELATLVVCDDDAPTRELLCDHLTADRYRALPAPTASGALRLCGYSNPDLLVLDPDPPPAQDQISQKLRQAERQTKMGE